jgi:hypothetical protein
VASPLYGTTGAFNTTTTAYNRIATITTSAWATTSILPVLDAVMPVSTSLTELYVSIATAPGIGNSYVVTILKNGVATGLNVTISDTNTSAFSTASVSYSVVDTVVLQCTPVGTPASSGKVMWSVLSTVSSQPIIGLASTSIANSVETVALSGRSSSDLPSEKNLQVRMPCAGTFSKLYATLGAAPGSGASKTVILRKNSADTSLSALITDPATTGSDTTNSVSVVAGDLVNLKVQISGTTVAGQLASSILFTPSNSGDSVLLQCNIFNSSPSATNYTFLGGCGNLWSATEAGQGICIGDNWLATALYVSNPNGSTGTYTYNLRMNSANTSIGVTLSGTSLSTDTGSESISRTDVLTVQSIGSGGSLNGLFQTGILLNRVAASSNPGATLMLMGV